MTKICYLIVNFGGPRSLNEIEPFLRELLCDKDVIRTTLPQLFHNYLFGRIARRRARKITPEYELMGGGSPIWADTEFIAQELKKKLGVPVITFHRYLPATHQSFIENKDLKACEEIVVFPLFPQFSWATTGSIARFFFKNLPACIVHKMRWIKSYPAHPAYILAIQNNIRAYLIQQALSEGELFFLFSAHGLPQEFIDSGDLYAYECHNSFRAVMKGFPEADGMLCYQSKFGPGEWIKPYTIDVCQNITHFNPGRKKCVFVPISFTSDHIETLVEIEQQYLPVIANQGIVSYRSPALSREPEWINAIASIMSDFSPSSNLMLIRPASVISAMNQIQRFLTGFN